MQIDVNVVALVDAHLAGSHDNDALLYARDVDGPADVARDYQTALNVAEREAGKGGTSW